MIRTTRTFLARAATLLLLAVLCPVGAWAQSEVVSVGDGSSASGYLPSYPNGTYSMSQQIYTAAEIGKAGLITSIAFYNYDTGSERNCDIYLSHTAKESFDHSSDWITIEESNKVFSGTIWLRQGQWTVIDFDTPFQYDGTQNLLLTVDDNTGKDTGYNYSIGTFDGSGNQVLYYYKWSGAANLNPTEANTVEGTTYYRKNNLQLCFETHPKPYKLEAVEVGDENALIQCSLRGDATAWNLRYRKVAAEGEAEQEWTVQNAITDRSFAIAGLTPFTKYEAQVQGVFADDNVSVWTESLVFTTNCCPVEQQAELIYALNSRYYTEWYNFAAQIVDAETGVEVAYLHAPGYGLYGGTVTLCCGREYKVNWIADAEHANRKDDLTFALYFEPGDLVYSMAYGEAPDNTAELTTFIMDCTPYCTQKPQNVTATATTFNSATITFTSATQVGEVVWSTDASFDPTTATPTSVSFDAIAINPDSWEPNPANASLTLTGLEPLTEYYVSLRNVCDNGGNSRWSDPVKVTTGSRYDAPSQVTAQPVNSRTEQLSWGANGNETAYNLYYRVQAAGTPVDMSAVQTFGGGNGEGFENGSWGQGIWSSYVNRPNSNTLFVSGVPAGSSFGFKAGQGKTGAGQVKFLYGLRKFVGPLTEEETMRQFDQQCLNDADRQARINDLNAQLDQLELKLINGEITQEEYDKQKADLEAEIAALNSLPTDAHKLARMKELEQEIEDNLAEMDALALKHTNGEISDEEYRKKKAALEAQNALNGAELSELRAITMDAENPNKDGFSITNASQPGANARGHRAPEEEVATYIFFIRHADPTGILLVKDITITPPESQNEWICIPNITGTDYTLTGLAPGTTYEVMVEPVYEGGTTGTHSPITVFTTLGTETDPSEGEFSIADGKKVQFAHGNLRYQGDRYEGSWSMAAQQYDVLGQDNIEVQGSRSYPAYLFDLLCWSTVNNYYGVSSFYYYDDEEAQPYFMGNFADWGESSALIGDLGAGWRTLSKDEWNYLLNERANAAQLKALATVNGVKGLLLLPDVWTAPDGAPELNGFAVEISLEQWQLMDAAGAVFLPAAGQMTSTTVDYMTTTTVTEAATYWTSTPSDDASGLNAYILTIGDTDVTLNADLNRRVATAVRLVKDTDSGVVTAITTPSEGQAHANNQWYTLDGRHLSGNPTRKGIYILNGRKVIIR